MHYPLYGRVWKQKILGIFLGSLMLFISFGKLPLVYARSDAGLQERLETTLRNDQRLDGAQVKIFVQDGLVVLAGTVRLYSQKLLYEQHVWQTQGVVEVEDEIKVMPRIPVADAEIEKKLTILLKDHLRFQHAGLMFSVHQGHVTLHGLFHEPRDVLFLKHKVAEVDGVIHIAIDAHFPA